MGLIGFQCCFSFYGKKHGRKAKMLNNKHVWIHTSQDVTCEHRGTSYGRLQWLWPRSGRLGQQFLQQDRHIFWNNLPPALKNVTTGDMMLDEWWSNNMGLIDGGFVDDTRELHLLLWTCRTSILDSMWTNIWRLHRLDSPFIWPVYPCTLLCRQKSTFCFSLSPGMISCFSLIFVYQKTYSLTNISQSFVHGFCWCSHVLMSRHVGVKTPPVWAGPWNLPRHLQHHLIETAEGRWLGAL